MGACEKPPPARQGWRARRRVGDVWRCGGLASNSDGGSAGIAWVVGEWVGVEPGIRFGEEKA